MSRAKIIDHYLNKLDDPDFEIIQIRKELMNANVPEEEISTIFRIVDNEAQRRILNRQEMSKARSIKLMGIFIFTIGLITTVGTYLGIIPMGDSYLLMYGPMGAGLSTYLYGAARNDDDTKGKFRRSKR